MRNLPSALCLLGIAYLWITNGFHWFYFILIGGAIFFWEYPVKENIMLLKSQIEESKARTENIRWSTKSSESQVKVNMMIMNNARR